MATLPRKLSEATCRPMQCPLCEAQGRSTHLIHLYRLWPLNTARGGRLLVDRVGVCGVHPAFIIVMENGQWWAEEGMDSNLTQVGYA